MSSHIPYLFIVALLLVVGVFAFIAFAIGIFVINSRALSRRRSGTPVESPGAAMNDDTLQQGFITNQALFNPHDQNVAATDAEQSHHTHHHDAPVHHDPSPPPTTMPSHDASHHHG